MPCFREKNCCVSRQYLVEIRSRRPCRWRNSAATSSRSAIVSTSSQTSGTATTTSARAETKTHRHVDRCRPIGEVLPYKVLSGYAEIDGSSGKLARYLRCREETDLQVGPARDPTVIGPSVFRLFDRVSRPFKHLQRLFLEPSLRRNCQNDAHDASASASTRSIQTENPTPGMGSFDPSIVSSRSYRPPAASGRSALPAEIAKTSPV